MTGTFTDSIAAVATSAAASLVFKATLGWPRGCWQPRSHGAPGPRFVMRC